VKALIGLTDGIPNRSEFSAARHDDCPAHGRFRSELLRELRKQIRSSGTQVELDLDQVTLVDVGVVRFLGDEQSAGVELRNCPSFVREWISRECNKVAGGKT
jgi:hypothetical protein